MPRWGFRTGWDDFLAEVRQQLRARGRELDDAALETGEMPDWSLRELAESCRDLDPGEWEEQIRASLTEAFGAAPTVELPEASDFRSRLRLQLFGRDYVAATRLAVDRIAMKPFGDAWLAVVQDLVGGEATTTWDDLAADGITAEQAFELGLELGVADTLPHAQIQTLGMPGATIELAVANAFYLAAVMLKSHRNLPADTVVVACALSWHHWVLATLDPTATRETLHGIRELVAKLRAGIQVTAAETIGDSLWWWPPGTAPEPFTPGGKLPAALEAALARS